MHSASVRHALAVGALWVAVSCASSPVSAAPLAPPVASSPVGTGLVYYGSEARSGNGRSVSPPQAAYFQVADLNTDAALAQMR